MLPDLKQCQVCGTRYLAYKECPSCLFLAKASAFYLPYNKNDITWVITDYLFERRESWQRFKERERSFLEEEGEEE